ncbi:tail terminator [Gordonia phage Tarzan]|uniref:Tail terminator n=1 Tax=Gordonia phage Tarzan TaxID=3038367 RepID=A0AAF0GJ94_9CAUD|nr:tail terminator [Gordonia phage Tarzan]WGH20046.1 tail terminator [Gordonia phage Tarzan]
MTGPVYVPSDVARAFVDFYDTALVDRWSTLVCGTVLESNWSPAAGTPYLVVFDEGGGVTPPIITSPTQRVTVWHKDRDVARAIAARALGLALCRRIPGVAKVLPGTSLIVDRDSRNGARVASFTVRTRARMIAD